mgnify:CR=1 FL=1
MKAKNDSFFVQIKEIDDKAQPLVKPQTAELFFSEDEQNKLMKE